MPETWVESSGFVMKDGDHVDCARLVSIHLGKIAALGPNFVPSGFIKARIDGPAHAETLGIAGDAQADLTVHGGVDKAIYAYPIDHYDLWQVEFPEHTALWGPGALGENLAIAGLDESDVCIGDLFRLGGAVLQVTQPRKPCFKLALRFNDQRLASRMVEQDRTGWYFRTVEPGRIQAGDHLLLLDRPHPGWTIARVNRAAYERMVALDALDAIAALTGLSAAWRNQTLTAAKSLRARLASEPFRRFVIAETKMESALIRSLILVPADGAGVILHEPGQHVAIRVTRPGQEAAELRRYTISDLPNGKSYRLSIKFQEGGAVSPFLHSLQAGDGLEVSAPQGRFTLDRKSGRPVALISAGVGITPMIAMLNAAIIQNGANAVIPRVWFLHCARNGADHAFAEHVSQLTAKYAQLVSRVAYTRPRDRGRDAGRYDSAGRIGLSYVERILPVQDCDFYICGPAPFMRTLIEDLRAAGVPAERIRSEMFSTDSTTATVSLRNRLDRLSAAAIRIPIAFAKTGKAADWTPDQGSLLHFAASIGIDAPSDCRMGLCGRCSTRIIQGAVDHGGIPVIPPPEGDALLCCAIPKLGAQTPLVLDL